MKTMPLPALLLWGLAACGAEPVAPGTPTAALEPLGRVALDAEVFDRQTLRVTRVGSEPALLIADHDGTASLHFFDGTVVEGPTTDDLVSVLGGDGQPTVVMGREGRDHVAWTATRDGFEPLPGWPRTWWGREGVVVDGELWTDMGFGPVRYDLGTETLRAYPGSQPDEVPVWAPSARAGRYAQSVRDQVVWLDLATETWHAVDLPAGVLSSPGVLDASGDYVLKITEPDQPEVDRLAHVDLTTGRVRIDRTQEVPRSFLVATPDGVGLMVWLEGDTTVGGELFDVRFGG